MMSLLSRTLMREPKYTLVRWLLSHADITLCVWCGAPYDAAREVCDCPVWHEDEAPVTTEHAA